MGDNPTGKNLERETSIIKSRATPVRGMSFIPGRLCQCWRRLCSPRSLPCGLCFHEPCETERDSCLLAVCGTVDLRGCERSFSRFLPGCIGRRVRAGSKRGRRRRNLEARTRLFFFVWPRRCGTHGSSLISVIRSWISFCIRLVNRVINVVVGK